MARMNLKLPMAFLVSLSTVSVLQAGPVAMWTSPWEPNFIIVGTAETDKSGTTAMYDKANFGKSATADLQTFDLGTAGEKLPGTSAFARALATATTIAPQDVTFGQGFVDFRRSFSLQGSPNGWNVTLSGFISGTFFNSSLFSANPSAEVRVSATIVGALFNGQIRFTFLSDMTNFVSTGSERGSGLGALPNGDYDVFGELSAIASTAQGTLLNQGSAVADFYRGSGGLTVTLTATPRALNLPPLPVPPPVVVPPPPVFVQISTNEVEVSESIPFAGLAHTSCK